jgi:hypothetical protein
LHPALIPPKIPGPTRLEPLIPATQMTGRIAGRPSLTGREMSVVAGHPSCA